jgi:hypothetical protein
MSTDILARCSLRLDFVSIMQTSLITCSRPQYFSLIRVNGRARVKSPASGMGAHPRVLAQDAALQPRHTICGSPPEPPHRLYRSHAVSTLIFDYHYLLKATPTLTALHLLPVPRMRVQYSVSTDSATVPHTLQPAPASCENISNI